MGTDFVICGNRLQNLWEQVMLSVGTDYVTCGNRLCKNIYLCPFLGFVES